MSSAPASHIEQVHRLFDDKAVDWADHYRPDGPLLGRLNQVAAAVAMLTSPGSAVLDLGCASGELARFPGFPGPHQLLSDQGATLALVP